MSELMRYKGRRSLITGVSLEPGQVYQIVPLDRKYGRDGFWVEVSDGMISVVAHTRIKTPFLIIGRWLATGRCSAPFSWGMGYS